MYDCTYDVAITNNVNERINSPKHPFLLMNGKHFISIRAIGGAVTSILKEDPKNGQQNKAEKIT